MKLSLFSFLPALVAALTLGACQPKPTAKPTDTELLGAINDNLHAMEKEDVDEVLKTVHPKSPAYASTGAVVQMMFDLVKVKYELSDLKVLAATPEEAQVGFTQRMEKVGGDGVFQNNIVHGVHILRPDHGQWKIYGTRQTKVTDLDGKPLPDIEAAPAAPAAPAEKPAP